MLSKSTGNKARYGIATCCIRVLEVRVARSVSARAVTSPTCSHTLPIRPHRLALQTMSSQPSCVRAMGNTNIVSVMFRSMSPLNRDAAFTLQTLKTMLETDNSDTHSLVEAAVRCDAVKYVAHLPARCSVRSALTTYG